MTAPKPRVVGRNARALVPYDRDEDKCNAIYAATGSGSLAQSHLRWQGWTLDQYRERFQLLQRSSTAAAGVARKLRRNALGRRQDNERFANPRARAAPRRCARSPAGARSLR